MLKIDYKGVSIMCDSCRTTDTHGVKKDEIPALVDLIKEAGWQVEEFAPGKERHVCLDCAYKAAVAERNRVIRGGLRTR